MLHTKVLSLLKKLDAVEFKGFHRFLQSPVFNTNTRVIALYELLKKYYPVFDSPKLAREKIHAKLYPNKKYSYQQLANLTSEFTRLTEEYFTHLAFKADTFQRRKYLARSYRERDMYDLFEKETQDLLAISKVKINAASFQQAYDILQDFYFHPNTEKRGKKVAVLNEMAAQLDNYYLNTKLLLAVEMKSREKVFNENYDIPLLHEIKALADTKKDNPSIYFYYLLLEVLESNQTGDFFNLKNYFFEYSEQVDQPLKISIFRVLNNFCLAAIRNGQPKFAFEHLGLYDFGIKKELILVNGRISTLSFLNAVTSGILCNETDWVKAFINKYQQYILPTNQKAIMTMAKAYLAFHEHQYDEVTNLLNGFKSSISILNMSARTLTTRAYFEALILDDSYYDLFLASLDSFNKYLYRISGPSQNQIKSIQNFIHYLRQLGRLQLENKISDNALNQLLLEIKNTQPVHSTSWFINRIEKIKELSKSPSITK